MQKLRKKQRKSGRRCPQYFKDNKKQKNLKFEITNGLPQKKVNWPAKKRYFMDYRLFLKHQPS